MMEWRDTSPGVNVQPDRYQRLLGYPRAYDLTGRAAELAGWARQWYAGHGRPWICARQAERAAVEGAEFTSKRLLSALRRTDARGAVLVAASAGPELEREAQRLWRDEKPDEYFFLEIFGSAVVESLIEVAGGRLCAWAEPQGLSILPHYSPGYAGWDVAEQGRLLALIGGSLPGPLEALDSGALRPKKSQLAVFGMATGQTRPADLIPCRSCSLVNCAYRREQQLRT